METAPKAPSVQSQLPHIVATYGPGVATDAARCRALLLDHCPPDKREGLELVVAAVTHGVAGAMLAAATEGTEVYPEELAESLATTAGMPPWQAQWAVGCWLAAFGEPQEATPEVVSSPLAAPRGDASGTGARAPDFPAERYQWHYVQDRVQYGPVAGTELRSWLASGKLPHDTPVYCEALADWVPAMELPCFAPARPRPPQPPGPVPAPQPGRQQPAAVNARAPTAHPGVLVPPGFRARPGTVPEPYTGTGWAAEIEHERTGIVLVYVPAGGFEMGSPTAESGRGTDEGPQHGVVLSRGYYMGKCEVTQQQWAHLMGSNPASFTHAGPSAPVESVSWHECADFCRQAGDGLRLPTEAEWEYACRAGAKTRVYWGHDHQYAMSGDYAWCARNSGGEPRPVGTRKPNAWGLHDMSGNVGEWCADWYGAYPAGALTDPRGPRSGEMRVYRGGSSLANASDCRSASRGAIDPSGRFSDLGFRVALSPDPAAYVSTGESTTLTIANVVPPPLPASVRTKTAPARRPQAKPAPPEKKQGPRPRKSKAIAVVLVIFLGVFGGHKFYLGRPVQGTVYLLCAVLCTYIAIALWFVDIFRYAAMSEEVFHRRYG